MHIDGKEDLKGFKKRVVWILEIEEQILVTWKLKEMTELGCEAT